MTAIGKELRQARLQRGLTLEDVFAATRIRRPYLQALEAEDWEALPSAVHARAFLRTYAEYLGLEPTLLLAALAEELHLPPPAPEPAAAEDAEAPPAPKTEPPPPPPPPPETAPATPVEEELPDTDWAQIFRQIGAELQERRELLGLSLNEVAAHTRLAPEYLQALEAGRFVGEAMTPVQARGFLQQYAAFIELDVEQILLRFADGLQRWRAERVAAASGVGLPRRWRMLPGLRRFLAVDIWLFVGLTVGMMGLFVWWVKALEVQRQGAQPTVPSISDVLLQTPTASPAAALPTVTLPAAAAEPTQAATALPPADDPTQTPTPVVLPTTGAQSVQLTVAVSRRVWLRVLVDGEEVLRERAAPGAAYTFGAAERIEVQTADAGALQIIYNGRDLGILGDPNTLLTLIFSAEAMMTPTATVSPTPTITPTPTRTPIPSPTPRPSATPRP